MGRYLPIKYFSLYAYPFHLFLSLSINKRKGDVPPEPIFAVKIVAG